ncbi:MAG: fimbrillin family protein [Bacteroidales bacterium]|nr:fimbrillin family protein [Bacteroidales bacterium]
MKKNITTGIYIICTLLFVSCEKSETSNKMEESEFYASYCVESQTKATTSFSTGNMATIFGYSAGADVTSVTPVSGTPVNAICGSSGLLTPSTPVFLPKGSYDFYSVSLNNSTSPNMTFSSGVSSQLSNGVDYLWAKCTGIAQGGTVSFVYNHKAVGIEINVASGTGITNLSVTSIKITPPTPATNSKMNLSSGSIGEASSVGALTEISLSGLKGTYIMLPLSSTGINIELTVNATIGGTAVTAKKYSASIPTQAYSSGYFYTINLTVTSTALQFSGALVDDWTNQTITGISLTEQ